MICYVNIYLSVIEALLKLLDDDKVYSLLLYLLQSDHNRLRNEGLVALTLAASFKLGLFKMCV